ncbi:MAG: Gfo/Idh/MocA family oxidoreductase [Erysipelotrichaceae bacterium]
MKKINIGIISPSEIAFRRFMPALDLTDRFNFVGIAISNSDEWNGDLTEELRNSEIGKAKRFTDIYGGKIFGSYSELITSSEVDAIYLPLPPGLHYEWGKKCLENKKHLFIEKPSTTSFSDTKELIELSIKNNVAIHENYMFIYHEQINQIDKLINSDSIGEIRLIKADFCFPRRQQNDFRYNKSLGGGSLLDCGGYPIKLLTHYMGNDIENVCGNLIYENDIDLYGAAQFIGNNIIGQISFGMDNAYKCKLEIIGNKGIIKTDRVFSAPNDLICNINIIDLKNNVKNLEVKPDDTFKKSLIVFSDLICNVTTRNKEYESMLLQSKLVDDLYKAGK